VRPPRDEYTDRQHAREAAAAATERTHVHLGNAKVALFLAAVIYSGYILGKNPSSTVYIVGVLVFVALSVWHESVMRALARARAAVAYYADGIARIEDRWMRDTPSGEPFRNRDHPYADDLDVFGPASLFQLVSGCRTPMGEERLAAWLTRPSPVPEIRDRQARVAALRTHIDLRERIAVVNAGRRRSIDAVKLVAWAEQSASLPRVRPVIVTLALMLFGALIWYGYGGPGVVVVILQAVNLAMLIWLAARANAIVESLASSTESAALDLISNVIAEIERERFDGDELAVLARRLQGEAGRTPASASLKRLARISDWAESRHNVFMRVAEIPFLVTLQIAFAAESWRRRDGRHLRDWVDAIGEMEALLSLAGYSYEHPADPFPEIVEAGEPMFDASGVAHPLIPAATAISNNLALGGRQDPRPTTQDPRILLVSGSNMAGKSTLMRTVGINVVLALAGAPVRARALRLTPLALGTCLRHTDSLQEHRSGFYTEALRIRAICDLLDGPLPVLFLFDELLSGTNSKDRRIAAEGVVRTMLSRGAIGMVTTHDLALTEIAAIFPGEVKNVHLQDKVENGTMTFDYTLRDGVITHSNALELMRMIGLDV
jgi:hypothetical protein